MRHETHWAIIFYDCLACILVVHNLCKIIKWSKMCARVYVYLLSTPECSRLLLVVLSHKGTIWSERLRDVNGYLFAPDCRFTTPGQWVERENSLKLTLFPKDKLMFLLNVINVAVYASDHWLVLALSARICEYKWLSTNDVCIDEIHRYVVCYQSGALSKRYVFWEAIVSRMIE